MLKLFVQAAKICPFCLAHIMIDMLFNSDHNHLFHQTSSTLSEQKKMYFPNRKRGKRTSKWGVAPQFLETLETVMHKKGNIHTVFKKEPLLCKPVFDVFCTTEDVCTFIKAGKLLHWLLFLWIGHNWALDCIVKVSVAHRNC